MKNLTLGTSLKRDHIVVMVGPHCALRLSGLSWSSLKVKHGSCKFERLVVTYDKDQLLIYAFRLNYGTANSYTVVFGCGAEATRKHHNSTKTSQNMATLPDKTVWKLVSMLLCQTAPGTEQCE